MGPMRLETIRIFVALLFVLGIRTAAPAQTADDECKQLTELYKQAVKLQGKNDPSAAAFYEQYLSRCKSDESRRTWEYFDALARRASLAAQGGDLGRAVSRGGEAVEICRRALQEGWTDFGRDHLAAALQNLSVYHSQRGDYDDAIRTASEALGIYRETPKTKRLAALAAGQLAAGYLSRGEAEDFLRAQTLSEEAVQGLKKGTVDYANALNSLAVCYSHRGLVSKAEETLAEADKIWWKKYGENSAEYAKVLNSRAVTLSRTRQFAEAIAVEKKALDMMAGLGLDSTYNYAKLLFNYAKFHGLSENYERSIEIYRQALPVIERTAGRRHDYYRGTNELSAAYYYLGNLEESEKWAMASAGYDAGTSVNSAYVRSRSALARSFFANANYRAAIRIETTTLDIYRASGDSVNMAVSLDNLGSYYYRLDSLARALDLAGQALRIFARNAPDHLSYAQALNNFAVYQYVQGGHAEALRAARRALGIYESRQQTETSIYAKMLGNAALYLSLQDSVDLAAEYAERAYDLQRRILGEDHPDNALMCYNLANCHYRRGDFDRVQRYFHRALTLQADVVRANFSHLTTAERETYWSKKSYIFRAAPALAYRAPDNDTLVGDAYNAMLFTKGLLLNSEVDFKKLLFASGNLDLLEKYNRIEALQQEKEACRELPPSERDGRLADIDRELAALEKVLVRECKEYGDFTDNLSIDFRRVAAALRPEDVAVEFMDFEVEGGGTTWMALVLRHGWEAPRLVKLFNRQELARLRYDSLTFFEALREGTGPDGINRVYNDTVLGRMVWEPLARAWGEGVTNVYFAPTGLFYQFGVEYLPVDGSGRRVCDLYGMNRLSSTKLPGQERTAPRYEAAFVYGGLDYDLDAEALQALHERYAAEETLLTARSLGADDDGSRMEASAWKAEFLLGAEEEADSIVQCLERSGVATRLYAGSDGTEESFKLLRSDRSGLLHIATHGFCYSRAEASRRFLRWLPEEAGEDDGGMSYSGLLLSGANLALGGGEVPKGVENGVLTAREISLLDLSWADLVVLSACQTGLGEVREDGVFGLQRGFKKAGARTLLMSLWSVSDEATCTMMTQFYSRLAAGASCREAFHGAQQALRESPEFSEPFYWASFIMLDGMD